MVVGFRSFPNGFSYVVLNGVQEEPEVIDSDRYTFPKGTTWPECLSWVRRQVSELCDRYDLAGACVKTIEPVARTQSKERLQIEAILFEYLYTTRNIICCTRIKSQLKHDIANFDQPARYLERVLEGDAQLQQLNHPSYQDACLAAIAELPS